ncbi:PTS sugar transporter subunit IIA [Rhizobium lentis]|uniref:PTS system nitrogen regulatory IIA component n=1 Tax=Rhizobium lentis TaxID=1138194 RepID=A0A7W8XI57_9HYPH|nr:PTS sugar transporter subunit IIA [Rhizobium lentis]MBB4576339.1 PTS system nitrogen regulatory IIA component [Rhizobium lentis]MBB5552794.1 PTS system nitrogen regulatory IIA component [Rhizobium lentis]MBB5563334.1 PTS system nitrogen regulatory IIA component [Rhizobium lentis]MBB5569612.1 PTS system nitrogen regulatory IIA component [Rhizobium lentis]
MNLPNIIRPEHTFIGVSAPAKWRALQTIADKAAMAFSVDAQIILKALEAREKLGSTGIGNGIAIPHAAIETMSSPRGLLIRFSRPLDFEAIDDSPADIAVVMLFGENNRGEYLNVLSAIARRLQSDGVLAAMRKARTADEFYSDFISDPRT